MTDKEPSVVRQLRLTSFQAGYVSAVHDLLAGVPFPKSGPELEAMATDAFFSNPHLAPVEVGE